MEDKLIKSINESLRLTELEHLFREKMNPLHYAQEAFLERHELIVKFCESLFKKYGYENVIKYQLFHVLAGSSGLSGEEAPLFDFEGDDSIENFIRHRL